MSKKTVGRIQLIYGIVLSLLLIATGILFMVACINIYQIGDRPFTTENIANAFGKIRVPVYITVAAVVVGLILWLCFPAEKRKIKASADQKALAKRLEQRLDLNACDPKTLDAIREEKKFRKKLRIIIAITCVEAFLPALAFVLNFDHFDMENYNGDIITACLWILPGVLVAAGLCLALSFLEKASIKDQLQAVKTAIAAQGKALPAPAEEPAPQKRHTVLIVRVVLAVAAVALIIAGIVNGGMADVLAKAINICTECIGLG